MTASTFPEHNYWSYGAGFYKLFCTCYEGYLVESRRPLRFGSSQANRSVFNTLSQHSWLAAVSCKMSIISLRLGNSAVNENVCEDSHTSMCTLQVQRFFLLPG